MKTKKPFTLEEFLKNKSQIVETKNGTRIYIVSYDVVNNLIVSGSGNGYTEKELFLVKN